MRGYDVKSSLVTPSLHISFSGTPREGKARLHKFSRTFKPWISAAHVAGSLSFGQGYQRRSLSIYASEKRSLHPNGRVLVGRAIKYDPFALSQSLAAKNEEDRAGQCKEKKGIRGALFGHW